MFISNVHLSECIYCYVLYISYCESCLYELERSFNKAAYKEHRRKIGSGVDNEMQPLTSYTSTTVKQDKICEIINLTL